MERSAVGTVSLEPPATSLGMQAAVLTPMNRRGWRAILETTKPGITRLVTITSMVGFVMSAVSRSWVWTDLVLTALVCMVGTALSAAGANSINQYMERDRDALMPRTLRRALPTKRATPGAVLGAGVGLSIAGVGTLLWLGLVPAVISLACIVSYIAVYTPSKTRTTLSTLLGAIPGALPPLIGWSAASTTPGWASLLEMGGLSLFAIMFVWQIPHFMAIAWLYREDYAKGGYMVLPVIDPGGKLTAATVAMWTVALLPATILPAMVMPTLLGPVYISVAVLTTLALGFLAFRLIKGRERPQARALFFGTIMQLPLLFLVMVGEAIARTLLI